MKQKQTQNVTVNVNSPVKRRYRRRQHPKPFHPKPFQPRQHIYSPPISVYPQTQSILQQQPDVNKIQELIKTLNPSVVVPATEIRINRNEEAKPSIKIKSKNPRKKVDTDELSYALSKEKPYLGTQKGIFASFEDPEIFAPFTREATPLETIKTDVSFIPEATLVSQATDDVFYEVDDVAYRQGLREMSNAELKSEARLYHVRTSILVETDEISRKGPNKGNPKLKSVGDRTQNETERNGLIDEIVRERNKIL